MSEASSSPKRPRLDYDDSSEKEDRYEKYKTRDRDHDESSFLPSKTRKRSEQDEEEIKEEENKSKNVTMETARREHTLVMRLTSKEQELQDCMNQIQEMKQAQTQNTAQLRSMLLDPAINLVFQRMAKEMDEHREKLKQKQNELSAWKFTPDSQTGMRLMAKCRMLLAENGELGKMISSGRTARLEGEIVLHKALVTEMKKNQKELDEFLRELDVDVEGMQGMILLLQQQLKDAREQIARLQQENDQLRTLRPPDSEVGEVLKESSPGPAHSWPTNDSSNQDLNTSSPHVVNSVTDMWPDHGTTKCAPVSSPCLSVTSGQNQSDHIISAQNSDADLAVDSFACKVTPDSGMQTQEDEEASLDNLYNKESSSNPTTCLLNDNRTGQQAIADSTKEQDVTDSCMERTDFSNDVLEDSIKIETSEYSCLSEDKTALHTSLGLNILMRGEEDKLDCQTRLSLLNGTSLPGQGL
ncbi:pre-mRNA-splicing regulator WTAP [Biomphalaria pfeifferi]|uniref:Pre-mRNA-splicing regulator WTAP n=1 Tax=Biomphalaria pfeifferi TaxID=112525 RepID=A0AAD8BLS3_BIOPF|nr:pre-mRNA-splicing regulator WTAP [Biomphalaria pfeifferi]